MLHLENKRNHVPATHHALLAKLSLVPRLRATRRHAEVGDRKEERTQHRLVEHVARRRGNQRKTQVVDAFAEVVRAHKVLEQAGGGQRVLFQASEVFVAVELAERRDQEDGDNNGDAQQGSGVVGEGGRENCA